MENHWLVSYKNKNCMQEGIWARYFYLGWGTVTEFMFSGLSL